MNIALWILQGVVAVSCLFHGWLYLFVPPFAPEMMACGTNVCICQAHENPLKCTHDSLAGLHGACRGSWNR
jgi:hypothetical protein